MSFSLYALAGYLVATVVGAAIGRAGGWAALLGLALLLGLLTVNDHLPRSPVDGCPDAHAALAYVQLSVALAGLAATAVGLGAGIRTRSLGTILASPLVAMVLVPALLSPWLCGD